MKIFDRFRKGKPPIRDYLYVDEKRLNSYLEQIGSTSTFRKAPSLKLSLSFSGPKVTAEQASQLRNKTNHEKICELIEYLEGHGYLGHSRPALIHSDHEDVETPDFVLEECKASRILIPAAEQSDSRRGIVIWVSEWPIERNLNALRPAGLLCVIQDSTYDDTRHRAGFSHSGYTWIQALLYQLHQEKIKTKIATEYPLLPIGEYEWDIMDGQRYLNNEVQSFRPYPLHWLKEKGCVLSTSRRIVALYRIRNLGSDEIGTENKQEDFTVSSFAYGIAIWAAPNKALHKDG